MADMSDEAKTLKISKILRYASAALMLVALIFSYWKPGDTVFFVVNIASLVISLILLIISGIFAKKAGEDKRFNEKPERVMYYSTFFIIALVFLMVICGYYNI